MRFAYSFRIAGAVFASLACAASAHAGGFARGSANLDPLYGTSNFGIQFGGTYVAPDRSYSTVTGGIVAGGAPAPFLQTDVEFGGDYFVPSVSVGGRIAGNLRCAGSYTQPYGADATYSGAIAYHIADQSLTTNEYGLSCSYGVDAGKGRLFLIGGVFYETVEFGQARNFTTAFGWPGDSRVDLTSDAWGYRLGIGYEIPEIAFKAQLLYRSQTDHDASGVYTNTPFAVLAAATGALTPAQAAAIYGTASSAAAFAAASLPQSVELNIQSGIAPGWLAFGSIKWTEWSVLQQLQVTEGIAGTPFSSTRFFFQDGWTVTGGVGHKFTEKLGGSLSLTWDKGVSTGWDTLTDTWSFAGGLAYDVNENVQFRAGGAAIYFTKGVKNMTSSAIDYTAESPAEWGYALSIGGSMKF